VIILAWPSADLSPNSRCHWSKKAKAAKAARQAAGWATKAAGESVTDDGHIALRILFYPPSKRRFDLDGLLSRLKSALDGVADALGVDDNRFGLTIERREVVKGGRVEISIIPDK